MEKDFSSGEPCLLGSRLVSLGCASIEGKLKLARLDCFSSVGTKKICSASSSVLIPPSENTDDDA